jgi:hypothetical protein
MNYGADLIPAFCSADTIFLTPEPVGSTNVFINIGKKLASVG